MMTSTTMIPAKAVIEEACPDGNDWVLSSPSGFCHGGRPRPISSLRSVVTSEVASITQTANSAARRCFRYSIAPASSVVSTIMPYVANAVSTTFRGCRSQCSSTDQRSSEPPRWSSEVTGPQSWVTSTATTAKSAKQSSAQLNVVSRDRSSTLLLGSAGAGQGRQYAGTDALGTYLG